ncbi:MAG: stage II sporulation protein P [Clostridia bacterium]|nr:stage II sporulation protein P [Clostridia bacterium]
MDKKYKKNKSSFIFGILKIVFFIILSVSAIIVGIFSGDVISKSDIKIVEGIDVENFKLTLNKSIPLIDTIYNSGNTSISISNEIRGMIKAIFELDLSNPITILNAQSPFLYKYYNNEYQALLKQKEKDIERADIENEGKDETGIPENISEDENIPEYLEDESSITYEGEDENKEDKVISGEKIAIHNESKMKIDMKLISSLLKERLKISFNRKGPQILIYHTHTTEGYLKNPKDVNKKGISNRTSDTRYNVVRVGQALYESLHKKYDFNVIHNGTVNDYDFNSAYNTAYKTVNNILRGNKSIRIVFDIHRDGLNAERPKLRVTSRINGKTVAKVMFVVGTSSRLKHPEWKENFKLALKIQEKLNTYYPGLARPINVSSNRYNQHVTNGALIIEIGGDGNTVEECVESTKYLSRAISEVLRKD